MDRKEDRKDESMSQDIFAAHLPVDNTGNGFCAWAKRREAND